MDDEDSINEFINPEITKVTSSSVQEQLLTHDTDPEFKHSAFWFRFQQLEKEITLLREGYQLIYNAFKFHFENPNDETIPQEYLRIIFSIAEGIVDGIQIVEHEIIEHE